MLHEYVHYVTRHILDGPLVPMWYSEGIADYFATFSVKRNSVSLGDIAYLRHRFSQLRARSGEAYAPLDIEDLFKTHYVKNNWRNEKNSQKRKQLEKEFQRFYGRSLATIHYFQSSAEGQKKLAQYIELLNRGLSVDKAFAKAFEISYEALDKKIIDYLSGKVKGWKYNINDGGIDFPEVDIAIKKLTTADLYLELSLSSRP